MCALCALTVLTLEVAVKAYVSFVPPRDERKPLLWAISQMLFVSVST